ncbi:MAG: gliding motility-associated C-terminal domain-containing protein [Bacteroidia bacterium]
MLVHKSIQNSIKVFFTLDFSKVNAFFASFVLVVFFYFLPYFLVSASGKKINTLQASHLMGGEITWVCQGNGQYVFTLKLYRDCNGINPPSSVQLSVFNHPTVSSIQLSSPVQTDISPSCNGAGPTISCTGAESQVGWPTSTSPVAGAVQESVYTSNPIALPGVPPPQGWIFTYADCCRNGSLSNLQSANSYGFTLRAVMYGYNGQNAGPCFDSSPTFLESPSTVICVGAPFNYNHNAFDPDLDSLAYSWAEPLDDFTGVYNLGTNPASVPFTSGYSFNSPLPGATQNPANVPASINPATGEISFTSYTQGYFATVVKVESWKCGILVAEIYREIQVVLLPCAVNEKPTVTFSSYQATVPAGTLVTFDINGNDPGVLADGVTPQTLTLNASGRQFGANFTDANAGCLNPPCATLSAPLPSSSPTNIASTFSWQTTCDHISYNDECNTVSNTYTFVFRIKDDFCPAPSENISTVSITVLATPVAPSPQIGCVAVLPNGDVSLTWPPAVDPGGTFNGYFIYSSTSPNGPFTLIDSVLSYSLSNTSYTHVGANASTAPVYYFVRTRSGCFGQVLAVPADTVSTIVLNVNNPANGTALLNWNAIANPLPSTSTGIYSIYVENPTGVWTLTGNSTTTAFIDSILACNATLNYRVEIEDYIGCSSVSTIDGGIFQNIIVPQIPSFDTVSVDDNNNATMSWNVSPSSDVEAYVVYQLISGAKIPIDTVFGINNVNYTFALSDADMGVEEFYLAAFDTCDNISPIGTALYTMYLTSIPQVCDRSVVLNWTSYGNIGTGLAGYNILQSTVGVAGPYTLVSTVDTSVHAYIISNLLPQTTYYYKIQAIDSSGTKTASSNRILFYSAAPSPPAFSYLQRVSVIDPNQVEITCHVDISASTSGYKVMRSKDNNPANFKLVETLPASTATPINYVDTDVRTDNFSYYYKIINVDSCGFDGLETNISRTILLTAKGNSVALENTLIWNDYSTWLGNVASYNVYRGIDGVMNPVPIANVPFVGSGNTMYTYIDDISNFIQGEGVFNYYIEALEGPGNTYSFSENSLSNIAEAYQEAKVYVPNAFHPDGAFNSIFKPVTTYVNISEYEFSVLDRWGGVLFTTNDVQQGWDGTENGKESAMGMYIYLVKFKTSRGEYIDYKGTVTLLR